MHIFKTFTLFVTVFIFLVFKFSAMGTIITIN